LPTIYQWPEIIDEGGLIGYGPHITQIYGEIVSRQFAALLRGIKPADIPAEQPTKFDLAINLKTAKALGLDVPATLLARADNVIERLRLLRLLTSAHGTTRKSLRTANYFCLLVHCGPKQTSRLTGCRQSDMLQFSFGW
jgi:ABC transporter substrate binding protein